VIRRSRRRTAEKKEGVPAAQPAGVSKKIPDNSIETGKVNKKLLIMDMTIGEAAEGIILADLKGRITYANKSFLKMFGCDSAADALWRPLASFFKSQKQAPVLIKKVLSGEGWSGTVRAVRQNGEVFYARVSVIQIINPDNTSLCIQSSFTDVTEGRRTEQRLRAMNRELLKANRKLAAMAYRDSHTGLYSHRIYDGLIEAEYQRSKRHKRPLSIMLIDVDFFKSINDVYGYIFGDAVLKQLANKFMEMTRSSDVVIRFGGEEFIIVLPETSREKALWLGRRIFQGIDRAAFGQGAKKVQIKVSAGLVSYPEDDIKSPFDMFALAEQCIKKAKSEGGSRICSPPAVGARRRSAGSPANITVIKSKLADLAARMNQSLVETIFEFARGADAENSHFMGHGVHASVLAGDIAARMGFSDDEIKKIEQAALLCNIGKLGLNKSVLYKKGEWSEADMEMYKKHIDYGLEILAMVPPLGALMPLIKYHHERWDGKGYPEALKENKIPLGARIISAADVYAALVSDRPFRKAFSERKALKIMSEESGKIFDPAVVGILREVIAGKASPRPKKTRGAKERK